MVFLFYDQVKLSVTRSMDDFFFRDLPLSLRVAHHPRWEYLFRNRYRYEFRDTDRVTPFAARLPVLRFRERGERSSNITDINSSVLLGYFRFRPTQFTVERLVLLTTVTTVVVKVLYRVRTYRGGMTGEKSEVVR